MHDFIGDPKAAGLGGGLAVLVDQDRAEHFLALSAAEHGVFSDALEHVREHLRHEHAGELLGGLGDVLARSGRRIERLALGHGQVGLGGEGLRSGRAQHHITSISACSAPAALIACRMVIRSRGPMPSALRPETSSCRVMPAGSTANFLSAPSSTWMSVRGTVTVVPPEENGVGCDTCGVSVMRMVRLPWAMATVLMRTFSPITMVPVRSSITTLAIWSGWTRSCSMSVSSATVSPWKRAGTARRTVPGSVGRALSVPR